jgi:hypothetical protein
MINDAESHRIYNELCEKIYPIIGEYAIRVDVLLDVLAHLVAAGITTAPELSESLYNEFQAELAKEINRRQTDNPDAKMQ